MCALSVICSYFIQVIKNSNGQFNLEAAIKNVGTMSSELKKINVESQLLLCDLILNFNHPVKAKDLREVEEKTWSLTD
ncbi:hypothetical protein Nmel_014179 [Mimus melanotis]